MYICIPLGYHDWSDPFFIINCQVNDGVSLNLSTHCPVTPNFTFNCSCIVISIFKCRKPNRKGIQNNYTVTLCSYSFFVNAQTLLVNAGIAEAVVTQLRTGVFELMH